MYMTIGEIISKIKKYWFVVIIFLIVGAYVSYLEAEKTSYNATVVLGINLANAGNGENDQLNTLLTKDADIFLSKLVSSKYIQSSIIKEAGLSQSLIAVKPFYDVLPMGLGYISINYSAPNQTTSETFIKAVKKVYSTEIVKIWNEQKPAEFKTRALDDISSSISSAKSSVQNALIPVITSIVLSLVVVALLPKGKSKI